MRKNEVRGKKYEIRKLMLSDVGFIKEKSEAGRA
jgi:hypothetical protein